MSQRSPEEPTPRDISDQVVMATFDRRASSNRNFSAVLDDNPAPKVARENAFQHRLSRRLALKYLDPRPTETILDLGCGMGRLTRVIAPRARRVAGIDVSMQMLKLAVEDLQRSRTPNVVYARTTGAAYPFAPGSFDKVLAFWVLLHMSDPLLVAVLAALREALKPGGLLVCMEHTRKTRQKIGDIHNHRTPAEYEAFLRAAGFTVLRSRPVIRFPSYARSVFNMLPFWPEVLEPALFALEDLTVTRKPESASYYTSVFVARR